MTKPSKNHYHEQYRHRWVEWCAVAEGLRTFSVEKALEYIVAHKLLMFFGIAEDDADAAAELPMFIAEVRRLFTVDELGAYLNQLQRKEYRIRRQPISDDQLGKFSLNSILAAKESNRFYRIRELLGHPDNRIRKSSRRAHVEQTAIGRP